MIADRWGLRAGPNVLNVIAVVALLLAARGAYRIVRAVIDVLTTRTITGEVLWTSPWDRSGGVGERTYLAVDDGSGPRTTAWALPALPAMAALPAPSALPALSALPAMAALPAPSVVPGLPPRDVAVGDVVEIRVHPWSRRVMALQILQQRRPPAPPDPAAGMPGGADAGGGRPRPAPLDAERLGAWLGIPLQPALSLPWGTGGVWLFPLRGGGHGGVQLRVGDGVLDRLGLAGARRQGTPLPGAGEEAYLLPQGGIARRGQRIAVIMLPGGASPPPERVAAALEEALTRTP
jgi:hypothetical protein